MNLTFLLRMKQDKNNIKEIMENCLPKLEVPSKVDVECGDNWGDAGD